VGANGPLLLAVDVPGTGGPAVLDGLRTAVAATPGVASVSPAELSPAGDTAVLTVVPATGPQDDATQDLVRRLRDTTIPATGAAVLVGGATATSIDSTADLAGRIPYLIAGVVLLSMLLLLAGFRSLAVAAKAAVMNLLSVAASFGVVALVHIEGRPERYLPAAERHDVVDAGLARLS
jgi:RND superfamily putative drug exporter